MMKYFRITSFMAVSAAALLLLWACDNKEETQGSASISVSESSLTFSSDAGSQTVTITTDAEWDSNIINADWVSVSPTSGKGTTTVTVTVTANYANGEYGDLRSTFIYFQNNNKTKEVSVQVIQSGKTDFTFSKSPLEFPVEGGTTTVSVYTDSESWTASGPDWITVSPASGSGNTELTVTAASNYVDGVADYPRSGEIVFSDNTASTSLPVSQEGDKYIDVSTYTVNAIAGLSDGSPLRLEEAIAIYIASNGFIVSDGTGNIFVAGSGVNLGDKVLILGDKATSYGLPVIEMDSVTIESSDNSIDSQTPTDITSSFDSYSSTNWGYVKVNCYYDYDGLTTTFSVDGASNELDILDVPEGIDAAVYQTMTLFGYYAGSDSGSLRIIGTSVDYDNTIRYYWKDDFEWLWAYIDGYDPVGDNIRDTSRDIRAANTYRLDGRSTESALDYMLSKGYTLEEEEADESNYYALYPCSGYMKVCMTARSVAIIVPAFASESGTVHVSFDWAPMKSTNDGVVPIQFDETQLVVRVINGNNPVNFQVDSYSNGNSDSDWIWNSVDIALTNMTITESTKVEIRNIDDQWAKSGLRYAWFIDNLSVYSK